MEEYQILQMEIVEFDFEDIITESNSEVEMPER